VAFTFKIRIEAPPEAVFDYLSDMKTHPEWANPKAKMEMEEVSGGPPARGATYRSRALFIGKPVSANLAVTEFDRPRRFTFALVHHQEGKKDQSYEQSFRLAPSGGGTIVEKVVGGGVNPVVGYLAYPAIRADAMTSLRNLKARLEAAA
jgi:uncharacterized protein YndB with AHSA1/START domain